MKAISFAVVVTAAFAAASPLPAQVTVAPASNSPIKTPDDPCGAKEREKLRIALARARQSENDGDAHLARNDVSAAAAAYRRALGEFAMFPQDQWRVREKYLAAARKLTVSPDVPPEVGALMSNATQSLQKASNDADLGAVAAKFELLVSAMPWSPEAYFNAAVVAEGAGSPRAAKLYRAYLLARPDAPDAAAIEAKIAALDEAERRWQQIADLWEGSWRILGPDWSSEDDDSFFLQVRRGFRIGQLEIYAWSRDWAGTATDERLTLTAPPNFTISTDAPPPSDRRITIEKSGNRYKAALSTYFFGSTGEGVTASPYVGTAFRALSSPIRLEETSVGPFRIRAVVGHAEDFATGSRILRIGNCESDLMPRNVLTALLPRTRDDTVSIEIELPDGRRKQVELTGGEHFIDTPDDVRRTWEADDLYYRRYSVLGDEEKTASGEAILREIAARYPEYARVHLELGQLLMKRGDYAAAATSLAAYLESTPHPFWKSLAEGKLKESKELSHVQMGQSLMERQAWVEAKEEFSKYLQIAPKGSAKALARRRLHEANDLSLATVYVYFSGTPSKTIVTTSIDEGHVALAEFGQYFVAKLPPGKHEFRWLGVRAARVTFDFEPGMHFVRLTRDGRRAVAELVDLQTARPELERLSEIAAPKVLNPAVVVASSTLVQQRHYLGLEPRTQEPSDVAEDARSEEQPADHAMVFIYVPGSRHGVASTTTIDGVDVAAIRRGEYFAARLTPGVHHFRWWTRVMGSTIESDTWDFDLKPGVNAIRISQKHLKPVVEIVDAAKARQELGSVSEIPRKQIVAAATVQVGARFP